MSDSTINLPSYIKPLTPELSQPYDSCFVPHGFLFPETREGLMSDAREFPLVNPFYSRGRKQAGSRSYDDILRDSATDEISSGFMDSTILHISEFDELLLNVQETGMQYCLHTQPCLRSDLAIEFPTTWDKNQSLLLNIPVFSEELCKWHYPISTTGYNVAMTDAPIDIDVAHNYPLLFGYLPNGDLAVYWEIAERLISMFQLDLEPLRTTVEGSLVIMPYASEDLKAQSPADYQVDTGIVVSRHPTNLDAAIQFAAQYLGRRPVVIKSSMYQYYRINLPIIQCEQECNTYAEATWGAFGFSARRLAGFDFRLVNNPLMRQAPIFSTENGNVIVSNAFFNALSELLNYFGVGCGMRLFPIQRIP